MELCFNIFILMRGVLMRRRELFKIKTEKFSLVIFTIIMLISFNVREVQAENLDLPSNNNQVIKIENKENSIEDGEIQSLDDLEEPVISEEGKFEELLKKLNLNLVDRQNEALYLIFERNDDTTQLLYEAILTKVDSLI